jgi:hypothetical protein
MNRSKILAFLALAAALAACSQKPAEPEVAAPQTKVDVTVLAPGWHTADGPGETALFHRFPGSTRDFMMSCNAESKTLLVESPAPGPDPVAAQSRAELQLGSASLAGALNGFVREDYAMWRFSLPVTPEVITALASANGARLVHGALFADSGPDSEGKFQSFATSCAAMIGATPPKG